MHIGISRGMGTLKAALVFSAGIFVFAFMCSVYAEDYRTPSGLRVVSLNPCAYAVGTYTEDLAEVAEDQGYTFDDDYVDRHASWDPVVTLELFVNQIREGNIGILRIQSHTMRPVTHQVGFVIETYSYNGTGKINRDNAFDGYLETYDLVQNYHIAKCEERDYFYGILLLRSGIDKLTKNPENEEYLLKNTITWLGACYSCDYDQYFHGLSVLCFDGPIGGIHGEDIFWHRMNGDLDREQGGPTNLRRATGDAIYGIEDGHTLYGQTFTADLKCKEKRRVVLSPIVIDHWPRHGGQVGGGGGWVLFDCAMAQDPSHPAEDVVLMTTPQGHELWDVDWVYGSTRRIEFTIPMLGQCFTDILVNPEFAVSYHNLSELDGNTNPASNRTTINVTAASPGNGAGPNGDFYNWTSLCSYVPMIDFEEPPSHINGQLIGDSYPGLEFPPSNEPWYPDPYYWRFGETTRNSKVYPFNYAGGYPEQWVDGKWSAYIGDSHSIQWLIRARIVSVYPIWSICLGYTNHDNIHFFAYDFANQQIFSEWRGSNTIQQGHPETHGLGEIWIIPQYGIPMSSIEMWAWHNTFGIDNLMVFDFSSDGYSLLPQDFEVTMQEVDEVSPGGDTLDYMVEVTEKTDSLKILCNWYNEKSQGTKVTVWDALGELYDEHESEEVPIEIPMIIDPDAGEWKVMVNSTETEGESYPVATFAAVHEEPEVDCYISGSDDIWWFPENPNPSDTLDVFAVIRGGDQYDKIIKHVMVHCYFGKLQDSTKADENEYVIKLEPGSQDTVYFQFDTKRCTGIDPCELYVVLDPLNDIEEYDEDNNVASKMVTFKE